MIQKIYFRGSIVGKPSPGPYDDDDYRKQPDKPKPDFIKEDEFKV